MNKRLVFSAVTLCLLCSYSKVYANNLNYNKFKELFKEPVTTSANGSPQRSRDITLNMEILTREDISRLGVRTIPELFRFIPGMDVRQLAYSQSEVGIRGYNQPYSERILVLVNGRQVYTDYYGHVIWDNIPVEMGEIEQVEVVKGPNTALFGFNATSGVINIVTTNPLHSDYKEVTVRAGSHALREVSTVVNQKINDRMAVKISSGGYTVGNDFSDVDQRLGSDALTPERRSIAMDWWMKLSDDVQAHVELTKNQFHRNEFSNTNISTSSNQDAGSARFRLLADSDYGMIEADVYHNTTSGDYLQLGQQITGLGSSFTINADNHITVAKLSNTFEYDTSHIFRLGAEYRQASNRISIPVVALDVDDLSYEIWSGSGLWDWSVSDSLRTSVALRYDYFELEPDSEFVSPFVDLIYDGLGDEPPFTNSDYFQERKEWSYNIGAVYQVDAFNTIRASTARGTDLPSFLEFGVQIPVPDFDVNPLNPLFDAQVVLGNPYTDTSTVTNYELGYERKMRDKDVLLRSAVFFQTSENMQSIQANIREDTGISEIIGGNIGDSHMYGLELGLSGSLRQHWLWQANYVYLNINDDFADRENVDFPVIPSTRYQDSVVNHVFNAGLGYHTEGFHSNLFLQYRSSFDNVEVAIGQTGGASLRNVDDQFIVNSNMLFNINDIVDWQVSARNILGQTEEDVGFDSEAIVWSGLSLKF
ncbi:MAG: TonB-dependent receptor [Rickettsiales bacterium]|nr:TonB-dependent receptor [Rickettsiales bacterium]